MRSYKTALLLVVACSLSLGCSPGEAIAGDGHSEAPPSPSSPEETQATPDDPTPNSNVNWDRYAWLDDESSTSIMPLETRFVTPAGYARVETEPSSFAGFLRGLPISIGDDTVQTYDGRTISAPNAAVVTLDIGDRNLQQCADTAIRLHAEYLWSHASRDQITYHFTSGDRSSWEAWSDGERFRIRGSQVQRVDSGVVSTSRETFRAYLEHLFMYAGTRSLRHDSSPVEIIEPGDFFVAPGSPGHAVMVLDVAVDDNGDRVALLGQGFMPAQELHVLEGNSKNTLGGVWWHLPEESEQLDTPSWRPFQRSQVRRFSTTR